jgi:hypothetical protein
MKRFLFILVILILLAGIPIIVFFVKKEQDLRSKATPATTLSFQPSMISKNVGDTFSANVIIDTGTNNVYLAALRITYDPNIISVESIGPGTALPRVLTAGDPSPDELPAGNATITLQSEYDAQPFNGQGTLAVMQFKILAPAAGPSQIAFHEETVVVPDERDPELNVLESSTPLRVTATGLPVPTPSPTLTPEDTDGLSDKSGGEASKSATPPPTTANVVILSPDSQMEVTSNQPEIRGTAPPGSTVTITIYSEPRTAVVYADSNGNWSYIPEDELESGPHDLVVTAQAPNGTSASATTSFVIAGGAGGNVEAENGVPIAGETQATTTAMLFGAMLLGIGYLLNRKNANV